MRLSIPLALFCALAACQPLPPPSDGTAPVQADSIVLDRSYCIVGFCPSYRVSVARTGAVRFHSRNFGDTTRVISESVDPAGFEMLVQDAQRLRFWDLPQNIGESRLCGRSEPDHPGVTVTIFADAGSKEVVDYLGCRNAPRALRRFEARIDSVAGSERWVPQPNS